MENKSIEVDDKMILEAFGRLESKQQKSITKSALRKGSNIIKKDVKSNVQTSFIKKGNKYKDMVNSVSVSVHRNGYTSKVHIMGNRKYYYSYILKFFGVGTKPRYNTKRNGKSLKKKAFRGMVNKINFFSGIDTKKAVEVIDETVKTNMYKLFNNK